ncbi:uncharacterized protein LTR77_001897 [Saxophila tyrrhenica]|uniref:Major facilitator superfamily (MFS) profile domain-containing protein n=1 Tax=Saxophila tyrrhenica TaxID=1690608 RepID=A0AAV9PR93_9PEZI|nr:hypothetical protein LTR77_001897 [Saxophila tyrrhenica]
MAFHPTGGLLLFWITASCSLGFMLFGYDQGVFGGLLSNPTFLDRFNHPGATLQGQIVSTYTIGCIIGSVIIIPTGDMLGRRRATIFGCTVVAIGGILQASAFTLPHMIVGRIVSGIGIGINTTTLPIWQSETCMRPSLRGRLVAIELTTLVFGFVLTNWMNFGFTYVSHSEVSWRFPLAFQSFLAIGTAGITPFVVESPRWLCLKDREDDARVVIARLLAKPVEHEDVREALEIMLDTLAREKEEYKAGWKELLHNGKQQTFRRVLLGMGTNYFQQMGGVNVVAYYLPVVLERSFGFTPRLALILSACDSMQWMFWGGMAIYCIEKFGRKTMMMFGALGCSLCFIVIAAGLGVGTKASNGVAVAFIFLFYFFFGQSFMAIGFLYPSEINSNMSRNRGAAIAMITNWCGNYIVVSITPTGIENLAWKFYIIFAALNLSFAPIIWFFYLETAGLSLDEIDRVFEIAHAPGVKMGYKEATRLAKEEFEAERLRIHDGKQVNREKEPSEDAHFVESV